MTPETFAAPAALILGATALAVPVALRAQPRIPAPRWTPDVDLARVGEWSYRGYHRRPMLRALLRRRPAAPAPTVVATVPVPWRRIAVPLARPDDTLVLAGLPKPVPQDARAVNDAITEALDLGIPPAFAVGDQVCGPDSRSWFAADTDVIPRVPPGDDTVVIGRVEAAA